MSTVFVSFLGTSSYVPAHYYIGDFCSPAVRFIQQALLEYIRDQFKEGEENRIAVLLTEKARERNWEHGSQVEGLEYFLKEMSLPADILTPSIPPGNSEEEIWGIFNQLFDLLKDGDDVYLDVTHGFRNLPMLAIVLANYAHVLKNISVRGIYYGAFETLGRADEVMRKIPLEERKVPIFDLSSFYVLQRWSNATDSFINHGVTKPIHDLILQRVKPILRHTKGQDHAAREERDFAEGFNKLGELYDTVRGTQLFSGEAHERLKQQLDQVADDTHHVPPLTQLISAIYSKIEPYSRNSLYNCYLAVGWCIDHGLFQQGITLLQETIVSAILEDIGEEWLGHPKDKDANKSIIEKRDLVSKFINFWSSRGELPKDLKDQEDFYHTVTSADAFKYLAKIYQSLRNFRNDINHAGFINDRNPGDFASRLIQSYQEAGSWFEKGN